MSSILLLVGGIAIALGIVSSYVIAMRAVQESRRTANYLTRQQNIIRARRAFWMLGVLTVAGISLLVVSRLTQFQMPTLSFSGEETPQPTVDGTQTAVPLNTPTVPPTNFILTETPPASSTATASPQPSVPLVIEALFQGNVTPRADIAIGRVQFSTQIENNLPGAVASSFGNPIKQMYAFFTYERLDPGVQWTAIWYRDGALQYYETRPWDQLPSGMEYSLWEQPAEKWLPGIYEVRIFIGNEWKT